MTQTMQTPPPFFHPQNYQWFSRTLIYLALVGHVYFLYQAYIQFGEKGDLTSQAIQAGVLLLPALTLICVREWLISPSPLWTWATRLMAGITLLASMAAHLAHTVAPVLTHKSQEAASKAQSLSQAVDLTELTHTTAQFNTWMHLTSDVGALYLGVTLVALLVMPVVATLNKVAQSYQHLQPSAAPAENQKSEFMMVTKGPARLLEYLFCPVMFLVLFLLWKY